MFSTTLDNRINSAHSKLVQIYKCVYSMFPSQLDSFFSSIQHNSTFFSYIKHLTLFESEGLQWVFTAGTSVFQVTATDADDPTYGNSARVVYSILHGQPYFSVDPQTGKGPDHFHSCLINFSMFALARLLRTILGYLFSDIQFKCY